MEEEEKKKTVGHEENDISSRLKFNFSYFNPESPGYDFNNLKKEALADFYTKLRVYSREPLTHWMLETIGKGSGHVYENYVNFPDNSDFDNPDHVPKGVEWGRFRMDYETRLVGFIVPQNCHGKVIKYKGKNYYLDCNVFYAVFLDMDHRFYLTKKK
ncbi:hypothetical protein AEQ63_23895 [Pseudomonas sp. RIT-PI-o]|nr:hypothetical protein AEQ63_23895 [Pseudomonas sp. RIT-PI-o]KPG94534.1 hypothetical protein AK821_19485 [Pseudomonas sp. RIT-PI-r]